MNPRREAEIATLIQRAELERLSIEAAWIDARNAILPRANPLRASRAHPWAMRALQLAIPVLGVSRVGRMMQMLSVGLMVFRVVRGLR